MFKCLQQIPTKTSLERLAIAVTLGGMLVVNVAIIYVFLYKPFVWVDGTIGRFMF